MFTLNYFIDEFFLKKKALIPLALEGSEVGKAKAAQALAKITISINGIIITNRTNNMKN